MTTEYEKLQKINSYMIKLKIDLKHIKNTINIKTYEKIIDSVEYHRKHLNSKIFILLNRERKYLNGKNKSIFKNKKKE